MGRPGSAVPAAPKVVYLERDSGLMCNSRVCYNGQFAVAPVVVAQVEEEEGRTR